VKFYASLAGDVPYPAFTLAVVEGDLPGGHSPAYFAELQQQLPLQLTALSWRNDPASFDNFPDFFLAHELAHQWFGQAVGWGNYHEQWLSEGFAQYFAALYAAHDRGASVFDSLMRQMRSWVRRLAASRRSASASSRQNRPAVSLPSAMTMAPVSVARSMIASGLKPAATRKR